MGAKKRSGRGTDPNHFPRRKVAPELHIKAVIGCSSVRNKAMEKLQPRWPGEREEEKIKSGCGQKPSRAYWAASQSCSKEPRWKREQTQLVETAFLRSAAELLTPTRWITGQMRTINFSALRVVPITGTCWYEIRIDAAAECKILLCFESQMSKAKKKIHLKIAASCSASTASKKKRKSGQINLKEKIISH